MAIVINGSGTVTGLAVGGLPDGTVDAGTLATDSVSAVKIAANSVDSAELIDGSIDTAHIAANQITSAIMPTGSMLQIVQVEVETKITLSSAQTKLIEGSITMKGANSSLLIRAHVPIGGDDNGNSDVDLALGFGYKTGGASSTSSDYSEAGGRYEFSRNRMSGIDSWFNSDTKQHGEGYDNHWVLSKDAEYLQTGLSYAVGTAVHVALWAKTNNGAYDFVCAENKADTDSGEVMTLHIMEIAG